MGDCYVNTQKTELLFCLFLVKMTKCDASSFSNVKMLFFGGSFDLLNQQKRLIGIFFTVFRHFFNQIFSRLMDDKNNCFFITLGHRVFPPDSKLSRQKGDDSICIAIFKYFY